MKPFYKSKINPEILANNAFKIVANMYSTITDRKQIKKLGKDGINLHDLRFVQFSRYSLKSKCKLENLPPTEGALRQHAFRTYFQLQIWINHFNLTLFPNSQNTATLNPCDWGWKYSKGLLHPIRSLDPLIPDFLLEQITCSCKTGCKRMTCGCKKLGLYCTTLCVECTDETCLNLDVDNCEINCNDDDDDIENIDLMLDNFDHSNVDDNEPILKKIRVD